MPKTLEFYGAEITAQEARDLRAWMDDPRGKAFWSVVAQSADECHAKSRPQTRPVYDAGLGQKRMVPHDWVQRVSNDNLAMESAYRFVASLPEVVKEIIEDAK